MEDRGWKIVILDSQIFPVTRGFVMTMAADC